MKTKILLFAGACLLGITLNLTSCQKAHLMEDPIGLPGDGGDGGGGGGGGGTPSPTETAEVTRLRVYFASKSGVDVSQIAYDANSDTFVRVGTTDAISHNDLLGYYFNSNLAENGNGDPQ